MAELYAGAMGRFAQEAEALAAEVVRGRLPLPVALLSLQDEPTPLDLGF